MKIIAYSENVTLAKELVTGAKTLGDAVALAVNDDAAANALAATGTDVLSYAVDGVNVADTAAIAQVVADAANRVGADGVMLASNRRGKELAGRVAFLLEAGCLTDVGQISQEGGKVVCRRNALGGATIAAQAVETERQVIAVSAKTFDTAPDGNPGTVDKVSLDVQPTVVYKGFAPKQSDSVAVDAADVLIAIGQGVDDEKYAQVAEEIARKLGGAAACSKPLATDRKWYGEDRIIGLSGALCKPSLAILFGISGQVQFSVGIRDAKTVVSVNTDDAGEYIKLSDHYLVADAQETLDALNAALA